MLRFGFTVAAMLLAAALVVWGQGESGAKQRADTRRPNIVFVSTNDQDAASFQQMPYASGAFQESAKTFPNHTFAYPLCCPTRVTWLRGQYPHNHGVWTNTAERDGGYRRFEALGYDRANLATRLKGDGYKTGMFGYYVNQVPYDGAEPGWNRFVGPNQLYGGAGADVAANRGLRDELISDNAVRFARKNAGGNRALFQWVSYYAPHHPFEYEPRFADRCKGIGLPPSTALDEDTGADLADKPEHVRVKAAENASYTEEEIAEDWRDRCRATLTADVGLRRLVEEYRARGELGETYFVFGTDNGWLMGEHGQKAKQQPYLENARFPLIVRGPGIEPGTTDPGAVSSVDIYPTFMDIANASVPSFVDGRSMLPAWKGKPGAFVRDVAFVEGRDLSGAPDYEALVGEDWTYTEWATGEKEYYDLTTDPHQLDNAYGPLGEERKAELVAEVAERAGCSGEGCRVAEGGP